VTCRSCPACGFAGVFSRHGHHDQSHGGVISSGCCGGRSTADPLGSMNVSAVPSVIPDDPPVMSATLPSSLPAVFLVLS
jgi:hypothetical protein